jgi:hypothetical protein
MNTRASIARRQQRLANGHKPATTKQAPAHVVETSQHQPSAFPNPWLFDTQALIVELDRARELVLAIPLSNATFGPINTATATLWELRERLRWLAAEVAHRQRDWKKSAETGHEHHAPDAAQHKTARKVAALSRA